VPADAQTQAQPRIASGSSLSRHGEGRRRMSVVQVNHVPNDAIAPVDQHHVVPHDHVAKIPRRRRKPSQEIARNTVPALIQLAVEGLASLQTPLLFDRQPIPLAEPALIVMLSVPFPSSLTVVLVELIVSILRCGSCSDKYEDSEN
jgi:hypothetical protein